MFTEVVMASRAVDRNRRLQAEHQRACRQAAIKRDKQTPLACAIRNNKYEDAKALLMALSEDPNSDAFTALYENDGQGRCAIYWAFTYPDLKYITLITQYYLIDFNQSYDRHKGLTPLMQVSAKGHDHFIKYLLMQEGLLLEITNDDGYSAFSFAIRNKHDSSARLLAEAIGSKALCATRSQPKEEPRLIANRFKKNLFRFSGIEAQQSLENLNFFQRIGKAISTFFPDECEKTMAEASHILQNEFIDKFDQSIDKFLPLPDVILDIVGAYAGNIKTAQLAQMRAEEGPKRAKPKSLLLQYDTIGLKALEALPESEDPTIELESVRINANGKESDNDNNATRLLLKNFPLS